MTRYLSFEDILRQVDRAGFVVRDPGLLASAVARPETSVFGEDAYSTMWLKAAALCQSIDNNQALVDGNKRLAWLSTKVFLAINGQRLETTADEGEPFMLDLVAGHAELPPSPAGSKTTPPTPTFPISPATRQHDHHRTTPHTCHLSRPTRKARRSHLLHGTHDRARTCACA